MIDTISGARGGGGSSFASGLPLGTIMVGGLAGYLIANSGEVHEEDKQELTRYCTSADVRPEDKDTCATLVQNASHDSESDGTSLLGEFFFVALIAVLIYIVLK
jgi:hypothetical protein